LALLNFGVLRVLLLLAAALVAGRIDLQGAASPAPARSSPHQGVPAVGSFLEAVAMKLTLNPH
jgi:hypothetical protein